jgi:hypothetical protein
MPVRQMGRQRARIFRLATRTSSPPSRYPAAVRTLRSRGRLLPAAVGGLAAAVVCLAGGCSRNGSGPAANGPLSSGVDGAIPHGPNCAPARLGQPVAFGTEQFTNDGQITVVLDRVLLQAPRRERLVGFYAVPGDWLIGLVYWPPHYADMPSTWKDRRPVRGFRLAPGRSFNMVLGVAAFASGQASSQGMLVYYHDAAGSYVASDDLKAHVKRVNVRDASRSGARPPA